MPNNKQEMFTQLSLPDPVEFYQLAELYKVLSDPNRLRIICVLKGRELCVGDIVKAVGASQSSVSHALAIFRASNLVKYRKEGVSTLYTLSDQHVEALFTMGLDHIKER